MTRNMLAKRHLPVLADFAASNVLLAFDYDGTLAAMAPTPAAARMRPKTRRLLGRLARRYPCVVISGRRLDDLRRHLHGIPLWHLVGEHGSEPPGGTDGQAAHVEDWVAYLRERLPARQGLVIEQKQYSVTVHYRHARNKDGLLAAIADAVGHLPDARMVGGAQAVNLLPRSGVNKGGALQQACRVFACDRAIYAGDDETDEDAFASAPSERLLSIRIGTRSASVARYRISTQRDIDRLLETLVDFRALTPARVRGA